MWRAWSYARINKDDEKLTSVGHESGDTRIGGVAVPLECVGSCREMEMSVAGSLTA